MDWRVRRKQRNDDLEDEITFDLAREAEDCMRAGLSPREAEQASQRDFGNAASLKEDVREVWGWTWLERLGQDLRYGARSLRKNPLFASMAVLSLALGIGANTAIYSVTYAILYRSLPVRNPGELVIPSWHATQAMAPGVEVILGNIGPGSSGGWASPQFPWIAYESFSRNNNLFSTVMAHKSAGRLTLVVRGQAELGEVELVSGNFFGGLGVTPAAGRLLSESDNAPGASQVGVLSNSYWRNRFAGDPAVIGQTVAINRVPFTVVGVAAPEFFGMAPGTSPVVYIPIINWPAPDPRGVSARFAESSNPRVYWVNIVGRLRPEVSLERAQADLAARFRQLAESAADGKESADLPALRLEEGGSGIDSLRTKYSKPLMVLMSIVALILAITCANIANLLLARAAARRREMAVRLSLGATRLRVVRQLLTESVMLALLGGVLGVGVAAAGIRFLIWLLAGGRDDFHLRSELDWRVLGFTLTVALLTGVLFGFAPAIAAMRVNVGPALKQMRSRSGHGRGFGLSQMLVVGQISLSLLLVLGAALFVRTLANLNAIERGYDEENLLTFSLNARQAGYEGPTLAALYARVDERLRAVPAIRAVTETDRPLNGGMTSTRIVVPDADVEQVDARRPQVPFWVNGTRTLAVGPAFFETIRIPILRGRAIDWRDADGAPLVAVVNEALAKRYFPNRNPLGQHILLGGKTDMTIVGVAKDVPDLVKDAPPAITYISYLQSIAKRPPATLYFALRTTLNPLMLAGAVREAVHAVAPDVAIAELMTQSQRIDNSMAQERTFADLCSAFAVLALMIACVGLYGSMAYGVSRRTNEIGIRMALGAGRGSIVRMVLREVLMLSATGLAIGLACAWRAMPAVKSFLYGVNPADPLALFAATGILLAALMVAGYVPARRASRIDPLAAVRHE